MNNPHNDGTERGREKDEAASRRDFDGLISTHVDVERAVLAQLIMDRPTLPFSNDVVSDESSLEELAGLVDAAGAIVVGSVSQRKARPEPSTLFGKGKVHEMHSLCRELSADLLVVDCDLTPAQGRNLENELKLRVIDRTELILDIFARRAQTRQAKLQVELAQLRYQLPRLKRMWTHLERIGGGIGLRGPGETQLETDKSLARGRINLLEKQLAQIRRQKKVESVGRLEFELAALVGYTNVGKSALLNALSSPVGKHVLVADQLFATLGTSTRKIELGAGRTALLSDTVGFVRRLPHHLVESFHLTLSEVQNAQLLLLVADAADPELEDKLQSVRNVLNELEVLAKPTLLVLNQCDRLEPEEREALQRRNPEAVLTSALTGEGLEELRRRMLEVLDHYDEDISLTLDAASPDTGRVLSDIARHGRIIDQNWDDNAERPQVHVRARINPRWREQLGLPTQV